MDYRGLRLLLAAHGFFTLAAAIVLVVAPSLIPSVGGERVESALILFELVVASRSGSFSTGIGRKTLRSLVHLRSAKAKYGNGAAMG
jgi:hypothetical protein